ncbi:MAG: nodulation S family protein [Nocardiaceae bacterium]|nr:nodulation S family protein [Nocardiaceae bacterium]
MNNMPKRYFEDLYSTSADPWGFETRWYERRKYALTLASLPRERHRRALEPGCSIGVLTAMLATRCDEVVATDVVESVLQTTRRRATAGNVTCRVWGLGAPWADLGDFDLVVLSEVGYYLDRAALRKALNDIASHLDDGGTLLSVHWQHRVADYPLTGSEVHEEVLATAGLAVVGRYRDSDVDIIVLEKGDGPSSVAEREGLV